MRASPLMQILDLARWAPSGDNVQPWRFRILGDDRCEIVAHDEGHDRVYNLDGRPLQLALGGLVEAASIAASHHGCTLSVTPRAPRAGQPLTIELVLTEDPSRPPDPLAASIPARRVQRRPLSIRALTEEQTRALEAAVAPGYRVVWLSGTAQRWRTARLLFDSARIRLTMPEAFPVHKHAIEWGARYSVDRVPSEALGVDKGTAAIMRWAMQSWERVDRLNRWGGGTLMPRILMDWLPGVACGAHVALVAEGDAAAALDMQGQLRAGRAMLRFWLTATACGLQHQPEMTPLIFGRYAREGRQFSRVESLAADAAQVGQRLDALLGGRSANTVWFGRVGSGTVAAARSERRSLRELILPTTPSMEPGA
jgi:nitroreductase